MYVRSIRVVLAAVGAGFWCWAHVEGFSELGGQFATTRRFHDAPDMGQRAPAFHGWR
jgi:hypothetical protein